MKEKPTRIAFSDNKTKKLYNIIYIIKNIKILNFQKDILKLKIPLSTNAAKSHDVSRQFYYV